MFACHVSQLKSALPFGAYVDSEDPNQADQDFYCPLTEDIDAWQKSISYCANSLAGLEVTFSHGEAQLSSEGWKICGVQKLLCTLAARAMKCCFFSVYFSVTEKNKFFFPFLRNVARSVPKHKQRHNNVISTSPQRRDVAATSTWRCCNFLCLVDILRCLYFFF